MPTARAECLLLWKLARGGDEVTIQQEIEDSDAVARNLVNWKHNRKGTTPLMEAAACRCGEPAVAKLIAAGADVNDVDDTKLKNTALHYAATTNNDAMTTETLLEAGADAFAVNRKGFTPLDVARQHRRKKVGAVLLEHMKVHSGWLFLRGRFRWKKRWAVVVACNKQRTSTELCIFRRQGDLRPELVMLIDEAARMTLIPSNDSYSWLKHDNAFIFDKPVMCHSVKRQKFTRSPICRKTMSLENVQTKHLVFAADSYNNLVQWRRVLLSSNFYSRDSRSFQYQPPLYEAPNGELYYWPHELVENLRSSLLKEQEQQREADNDTLYQRLRSTFEQRESEAAQDTPAQQQEPEVEPTAQPPDEPVDRNDELPPNFRRREEQSAGDQPVRETRDQNPNRVHFTPPPQPTKYVEVPRAAQRQYVGRPQAAPASVTSGSDIDTVGPEFATGILLLTDTESRGTQSELRSEQQSDTHEEQPLPPRRRPDEQTEDNQPDLCGICDVAPRNGICTPCGHQAGCTSCLQHIMHSSQACPMCQAPVRSVLKVYD